MERSIADDLRAGRSVRSSTPRSSQGELRLPLDRDAVGVVELQHRHRLADLVPVRVGRMLESPFAYYRATAAVMAADLAAAPCTGVHVVASGDAHLSNFGVYGSAERSLVFDLNDFDEAGLAPWEWDIKRLAASIHVAGRDLGMDESTCRSATRAAAAGYRTALAHMFQLTALERYFLTVDTTLLERLLPHHRKDLARVARRARARTSEQVLGKLATVEGGGWRIVEQPPLTRHIDDVTLGRLLSLGERYRATLPDDAALLISQFSLVDAVLRVVGVGSVGTRCYLLLFRGPGGEPLFLQAKEAVASALTTHGGMPATVGASPNGPTSNGHRVVAAQRILQAQSDPFLGYLKASGREPGPDAPDYYWRQFRDMKDSVRLKRLDAAQFNDYGVLCSHLLARAHAQSPGAARIVGYLGGSERFEIAISTWSAAYADVVARDFAALEAAVAAGRLPAERGV